MRVAQGDSLTAPGRESHRPMEGAGGARPACCHLVQAQRSMRTALMAQQHPGYGLWLHLDMCRGFFSLQREDDPLTSFIESTFSQHVDLRFPMLWQDYIDSSFPSAPPGSLHAWLVISPHSAWHKLCAQLTFTEHIFFFFFPEAKSLYVYGGKF